MSEEQAGAKTELRRSFSLRVLAAVAGTISTFALTVIVVRSLDARDSAAFFAILAALSIGSIVGKLGLGPNVIRLIPAEPDPQQRKIIAGTHLKAVMALTGPTAPIVALCATFGLIGHGNFIPVLVLTSAIIMLESVRMMLSDIFAATGRVVASVATMHYIRSTLVVPVIGLVTVLSDRPTLVTVLAAYAAVSAVQLAVALWVSRRDVSMSGSAGLAAIRAAVSSGTRLFSLDFSAFMMVSGSIWLANAAFEPETATLYSAAATIAMQVTILEGLTALAVTPPAARLWSAGRRHEVVRLLSNLATVNTAIIVAVIVLLMIFGGAALQLAYGPEMRPANTLLVIMACGGILQGAFAVNISLLIIAGRIDEISRTAMLVLAVVFPAALAAAYFGGPVPLAIVSAAGLSLLSFAQWLTARRCLDEAPRPHHHLIHAVRDVVSETSGSGAAQKAD